jgi:hypothetical protein
MFLGTNTVRRCVQGSWAEDRLPPSAPKRKAESGERRADSGISKNLFGFSAIISSSIAVLPFYFPLKDFGIVFSI